MIYSNKGVVQIMGKTIDVLVDLSVVMERILKNTSVDLREDVLDGIKGAADLAMEMIKKDENTSDKRSDDEVLKDFIHKSLYFNESEED
jgi:hypothetical protein